MNHQGHPQTTEQARYDFMSHFQDPVTPGPSLISSLDFFAVGGPAMPSRMALTPATRCPEGFAPTSSMGGSRRAGRRRAGRSGISIHRENRWHCSRAIQVFGASYADCTLACINRLLWGRLRGGGHPSSRHSLSQGHPLLPAVSDLKDPRSQVVLERPIVYE